MKKRSPALDPDNIDRSDPDALYTALQGMNHLGTSRTTYYDLIKRGLLHGPIKVGTASRWRRRWLDECVDILQERSENQSSCGSAGGSKP